MRNAAFATVLVARNCRDAERAIQHLKAEGFHPAELGLTAPVSVGVDPPVYPVEVPSEEKEEARMSLGGLPLAPK